MKGECQKEKTDAKVRSLPRVANLISEPNLRSLTENQASLFEARLSKLSSNKDLEEITYDEIISAFDYAKSS